MTRELNVLALFKRAERFIFVYDDESRGTLIDELRHQAADPGVALNWFDASLLTERLRELPVEATEAAERDPLPRTR